MTQIVYILFALLVLLSYPEASPEVAPAASRILFEALRYATALFLLGRLIDRWHVRRYATAAGDARAFVAWSSRWQALYSLLMLSSFALMIHVHQWPELYRNLAVARHSHAIVTVLGFAPFLAFYLIRYLTQIPFERLAQRADWSLASYLRFKLFPLLPVVPMVIVTGLGDLSVLLPAPVVDFFTLQPLAHMALMLLSMWALISAFPYLVIWLFRCRPLPDGPTRQMFEHLLHSSGVRCREIYVWPTGGLRVPNAMMTGVFPGWHVVFVTDTILAMLPPPVLLGVFAHELGHARYRHLLLLSLFLFSFPFYMLLIGDAGERWFGMRSEPAASALTIAVMIAYWGGLFGFVSRRFERQADLYAARLTGSSMSMIGGLLAIQAMFERYRKLPGFLHFTIDERVRFLVAADADPGVGRRFDRRVRALQTAILLSVLVGGWLAYPLYAAEGYTERFLGLLNEDRNIPLPLVPEAERLLELANQANPRDYRPHYYLAQLHEFRARQDAANAGTHRQRAMQEWRLTIELARDPGTRAEAERCLQQLDKN